MYVWRHLCVIQPKPKWRCSMKQLLGKTFLVMVLSCVAGSALASNHSAPVPSDFIGMIAWEIQHFMIHMGLTAQALMTLPGSSKIGLMMLDGQAQCAATSLSTDVFFSTAWSALLTFFAVLLGVIATLCSLYRRVAPYFAQPSFKEVFG